MPSSALSSLEPFLVSTGLVALGEMGDKTQLLSLVLALRYRKPWLILAGILVATLVNHGLAAKLGELLPHFLSPTALKMSLALGFVAMGLWMLVPDKLDEEVPLRSWGVFFTTCFAFFIAEMGDKTQVATIALAAKYQNLGLVVVASTLGMMIANAPVVLFGEKLTKKIPMRLLQRICAGLFVAMGIATWIFGS